MASPYGTHLDSELLHRRHGMAWHHRRPLPVQLSFVLWTWSTSSRDRSITSRLGTKETSKNQVAFNVGPLPTLHIVALRGQESLEQHWFDPPPPAHP